MDSPEFPSDPGGSQGPKKRKTDTIINVSTQNRFEILSDEEEDETPNSNPVKNRIPPVVIIGELNNNIISTFKHGISNNIDFKYKNNRFEVITKSPEDHKKALKIANDNMLQHYTFPMNDEKNLKLVAKNIPSSLSEDEIKDDLSDRGLDVMKVKQMEKSTDGMKHKMPIFIIHFSPKTTKKSVFSVKAICKCIVKWETYKNKSNILQCYKCQSFGHGSLKCHKNPKCVKCAGDHFSSECNKSAVEDYKCANCNNNHSAKDKSCPIYLKIESARISRKTSKSIKKQEQVQPSPPPRNDHHFPDRLSKPNDNVTVQPSNSTVPTNANNLNQNSNPDNHSFLDIFKEMKSIFSSINFNKFKTISLKVANQMRSTNDIFSKISYLVEGIVEYCDGP